MPLAFTVAASSGPDAPEQDPRGKTPIDHLGVKGTFSNGSQAIEHKRRPTLTVME